MCGINGIYYFDNSPVDRGRLEMMNSKMLHRGPDDEGYHIDGNVGLAMRRLSIIDLEKGHQPIFNEDGNLLIIMNGEIYNYKELRPDLLKKGHTFSTDTDTEVVLHLYEEEGFDCVRKLNGMFAFCVYDNRQKTMWLVRDRIGIKPLYYYRDDRTFVFSSQLDAVSAALERPAHISREGFLLYLTLGYVPHPHSIREGISKLEPAHWMVINNSGVITERYWQVNTFGAVRCSEEEAGANLLELLQDSIRLQQRSDVPIGTFLSGGVDSSAVVSLLARQVNEPVRTYSIDFSGDTESELPYARTVAESSSTVHKEFTINPSDIPGYLSSLVPFMDEPVSDSAIIPSFILSGLAREDGVKVILNGTGGDETFYGYPWQSPFPTKIHKTMEYVPSWLNRFILASAGFIDSEKALLLRSLPHYHAKCLSGVDYRFLKGLLRDRGDYSWIMNKVLDIICYSKRCSGVSEPHYMRMYLDLQEYLVGDILALLDKTSMAVSLEGRVPLLDHRIVEYAFALEKKIMIGDDRKKKLFKSSLRGIVPAPILERKNKMGFAGPMDAWFSNGMKNTARRELLENTAPEISEHLNMDLLAESFREGRFRTNYSEPMFNLYVFNVWRRNN